MPADRPFPRGVSIITTEFGRFRPVKIDGEDTYEFECPGCGEWGELDNDQWEGRVSVDHAADGCKGGYHETHNYFIALAVAAGHSDAR